MKKTTKIFKHRRFVVFLLLVMIAVFSTVELTAKHASSIEGINLGKLQDEVKTLQLENTMLEEELLNIQSFRVIEEKAKQMGFVERKEIYQIK